MVIVSGVMVVVILVLILFLVNVYLPADPTGPGPCSLLLTLFSIFLIILTLPLSLLFCLKVSPLTSHLSPLTSRVELAAGTGKMDNIFVDKLKHSTFNTPETLLLLLLLTLT